MRSIQDVQRFVYQLQQMRDWALDNDVAEARDYLQEQINVLLEIAIEKMRQTKEYWALPE